MSVTTARMEDVVVMVAVVVQEVEARRFPRVDGGGGGGCRGRGSAVAGSAVVEELAGMRHARRRRRGVGSS